MKSLKPYTQSSASPSGDRGMLLGKFMKNINSFLLGIILIASGAVAGYLFLSYQWVPVNEDAGYYIPVSEEVLRGATPTVEVNTTYPPGVYYAYALWIKLFGADYSTIVFLIYAINAVNTLLLYLILSYFVKHKQLRIIICLSYYFSTMLLEGYTVVLEPFQVIFILLAYLVYLKDLKYLLKYALAGFFLGCSIMFKQYSLLVLAGFLITVWLDSRKSGDKAFKKLFIITAFSTLPFFAFVLFTKAGLINSLYSFGFLGKMAISYAMRGQQQGLSGLMRDVITRILQMNWLFIPFLIYLIFRRDSLGLNRAIAPLFISSLLPLTVRQFGHYFQLIAPWSYIILGIVSVETLKQLQGYNKDNRYVLLGILACFFIILPSFLMFTHSFYPVHKPYIAAVTSAFLFFVSVVVYSGLRLSGYRTNKETLVAVFISLILFETIFLGMKIPFSQFRTLKNAQLEEAKEINKIFRIGSSVYVINYPQLYVTCKFRNPLNNNSFPITAEILKTIDWSVIENIIIKRDSPVISTKELNEHGYAEIETAPLSKVSLFKRRSNNHVIMPKGTLSEKLKPD